MRKVSAEPTTLPGRGVRSVRPGSTDPLPIPTTDQLLLVPTPGWLCTARAVTAASHSSLPSPDVDEGGCGEVEVLGKELQQPHASSQPQGPVGTAAG